jgi:predicted  nucleic acid-binding Zn ribbon protein
LFTAELTFECYQDSTLDAVNNAITQLVDALRYNGQILGREFPTSMQEGLFITRVVCPEEDSLHPNNHSVRVRQQLQALSDAGLLAPKIRLTGIDLHSDNTDPCLQPSWQILYTHYLSTCSPLRCGDHFAPIPLYKLPMQPEIDQQPLLRWQIDWSSTDELQMHGTTLQQACSATLTDLHSPLNTTGWDLAQQIEQQTNTPTYYYLYHIGEGDNLNEQSRCCPSCGGEWRLSQPLHGIFDFKCESCRLLSNLPW